MNSFFMGSKVSMAERYASLLKTMFVCLFFSAIFPQGYFVASMAMFMTYWVSRQPRLADVFFVMFCFVPSFVISPLELRSKLRGFSVGQCFVVAEGLIA